MAGHAVLLHTNYPVPFADAQAELYLLSKAYLEKKEKEIVRA